MYYVTSLVARYHCIKLPNILLLNWNHADAQPAYIRSATYAGATARCKHYRHIESAKRKRSYNIHSRPIVIDLTREN